MPDLGKVLLADPDPEFLAYGAELLRRANYEVETVGDAESALSGLKAAPRDVIVYSVENSGEPLSELLRDVRSSSEALPIILTTDRPTLDVALEAVNTSVAALLIKPIEDETLLKTVQRWVARSRIRQHTHDMHQNLVDRVEQLETLESVLKAEAALGSDDEAWSFAALALSNLMGSALDLEHLLVGLTGQRPHASPCRLMDCPRRARFVSALQDAVKTLNKTKAQFRSKDLKALRERLEALLEEDEKV